MYVLYMNGNINMSLRYLYKDLNGLGTYPDIITCTGATPNGNIDCKDVTDGVVDHFHMNKYYRPLFHYNKVMFNESVLASTMGVNGMLILIVKEKKYTINTSSTLSITIKCKDGRRVIGWSIRYPWNFNKMLLVKYREITDLDSLCEVIKDILR